MNRTPKGLLAGPKFNTSHSTVIPQAEAVVRLLAASPHVQKIVLGPIHQARGGAVRVKTIRIPVGLRVAVSGGTGVQWFFVHTDDPAAVEAIL